MIIYGFFQQNPFTSLNNLDGKETQTQTQKPALSPPLAVLCGMGHPRNVIATCIDTRAVNFAKHFGIHHLIEAECVLKFSDMEAASEAVGLRSARTRPPIV